MFVSLLGPDAETRPQRDGGRADYRRDYGEGGAPREERQFVCLHQKTLICSLFLMICFVYREEGSVEEAVDPVLVAETNNLISILFIIKYFRKSIKHLMF